MQLMTDRKLLELGKQAMKMEDVVQGMVCAEPGAKYHAFLGLLAKESQPDRIVELGTYIGESTRYMAMLAPEAEVWTVDSNPDAKKQVEAEPKYSNIRAFTADSVEFATHYDGKPIDLLFIDANHDYTLTMANYRTWAPFVADDGLIVMDDATLDGEMKRAMAEIEQEAKVIYIPKIHATGFAIIFKGQ